MYRVKAEKLICPFVRNIKVVGSVAVEENSKCITTKCMAWKSTNKEDSSVHTGYCKRIDCV